MSMFKEHISIGISQMYVMVEGPITYIYLLRFLQIVTHEVRPEANGLLRCIDEVSISG
jgi:hypothetical protein